MQFAFKFALSTSISVIEPQVTTLVSHCLRASAKYSQGAFLPIDLFNKVTL
jgi:hypothetical protein